MALDTGRLYFYLGSRLVTGRGLKSIIDAKVLRQPIPMLVMLSLRLSGEEERVFMFIIGSEEDYSIC